MLLFLFNIISLLRVFSKSVSMRCSYHIALDKALFSTKK